MFIFSLNNSSPQKGLRTPTKTPIKTPIKLPNSVEKNATSQNDLMSPKKAVTPRRLFSPSKANATPAYERFFSERVSTPLPLPYKYHNLYKIFRYVDWICSMFYNRKETITFEKLEPAVKRMMRKDFTEHHLAQIKYLDADAYTFERRKMLNPGSHSKTERYQLIVTPNIDAISSTYGINEESGLRKLDDGDDVVRSADSKTMNPKVLTARYQRFQKLLLDRVKHEHDIYLRNLKPPVIIAKERIQRWHQDFDLDACPDILPGELPQRPNVERFSSAKDILSTARNLFNCPTANERMMERYEASKANNKDLNDSEATPNAAVASTSDTPESSSRSLEEDARAKLLKNVPKALVCFKNWKIEKKVQFN